MMDPDANLTEQLDLARALVAGHNTPYTQADAARLAELVLSLDAWRTRGGCLPVRWRD